MKWLTSRWLNKERKNMRGQDGKQQEECQKIMATLPLRDYLIALMDEVVRQGIYLTKDEQAGARHTIETLKREIEKGDTIMKRENKKQVN